jgi:alkanesulfonate monooxygenase SsuD/methylene tetrahydromethanopterin reductase-like flavin-dependent oxidoreductase (luciferase family)
VAVIVLTAAAWLGDASDEATPRYTPTFAVTPRPWNHTPRTHPRSEPNGRRLSNGLHQLRLDQHWGKEIQLAHLAADTGFDDLWSVEHHFNDYSFCPDNLQLMAYLAATCPNIDLGTAAVILPWHDPLRVAERAIVVDLLSRLRLGMGRAASRAGNSTPSAAPWSNPANV